MADTKSSGTNARIKRGIALYRTKGHEIARDELGDAPVWYVPSCTGDKVYTVNLVLGCCTCPDFERRGRQCKHIVAAQIADSKGRSRKPAPKSRIKVQDDPLRDAANLGRLAAMGAA